MFTRQRPITELHVGVVIETTGCNKHQARKGDPCWRMYPVNGMDHGAVCNKRALSAGYNGTISPQSLSRAGSRKE